MTEVSGAFEPTFKVRLGRFLKAWLILGLVLIPAILAAVAGMALFPLNGQWSLTVVATTLAMGLLYCVPLALAFSVLGAPFVALRRWIVAPDVPHVRAGYVGVVLYGPILLALVGFAEDLRGFLIAIGLYEVIAYLATVFFARVWRSMDMFEEEARSGAAPVTRRG